MAYDISITIISLILLMIALRGFIKISCFNKANNFDKRYKATRINANKYSVDKWTNKL
jgi:hypothetical protein